MFRRFSRAVLSPTLLIILLMLPASVLAVSVGTVTVSPSVVAVPTSAARQTAVLISATIAGLTPGSTASCTVTLTLLPSGTVIATSPAVSTSPAPASGTSSMSVQMLVPGLTAAGPAQAAVNCGSAAGSAQFRISSLVGLNVVPRSLPAGGTSTMTVMIAAGGPLAATPCTVIVTDASGSSPPLLTQTVSVSGGTATVPASTAVSVTLPQTAVLGTANASVSCVVAGFGTSGDSADFTVIDPTVVTVLGLTTPALAGAVLTITSVTLPGYSCVALFNPPAGARIASTPALADATGTVVNTVPLPIGIQPGTGSATVVCSDPSNPANTASSAPQP